MFASGWLCIMPARRAASRRPAARPGHSVEMLRPRRARRRPTVAGGGAPIRTDAYRDDESGASLYDAFPVRSHATRFRRRAAPAATDRRQPHPRSTRTMSQHQHLDPVVGGLLSRGLSRRTLLRALITGA